MKKNLIAFFTIFISSFSQAHPGIGIVKDSKGFIYYTDLIQVWKVDPVTLKETVVVPQVHTHELYIDANDALYGEHLWYNGEKMDTWGYYVWRMNSNGKLDTIIKPTEGFLDNYSFTRDSMGNMYWVQRFNVSRFKMKSVDGVVTTIAEGKFKDIRWMHVTKDGIIYFTDLTDLYKLDRKGKFTLLARNLHERTSISEYGSLKHNIFGIWTDKDDNIYLAVTGGQVVKKITPEAKVSSIFYSSGGWTPTGGVFDDEGNLWLLESKNGPAFSARVIKIDKLTLMKKPSSALYAWNKTRPLLIIAVVLLLVFIITIKIFRMVKKKLPATLLSFGKKREVTEHM